MIRKFIFKDTVTGEELVLPVTPKGYEIGHGREVNSLVMQTVGTVNLPGPPVLLDMELECLFPAREYPFALPGSGTNPWVYLEKLEKWSDAGRVLRFVVSDTPVNAAVLLGPIRYREQDGTNDVYATAPVRGYRELKAAAVLGAASPAGPAARAVEGEPSRPETYTVVSGDTLGAIARRFYGDASLAARLAAANGVKNVNLIHTGQVLRLPPKEQLPPAAAGSTGAVTSGTKAAEPETARLTVINTTRTLIAKPGILIVGYDGHEHGFTGQKQSVEVRRGGNVSVRWQKTNGHDVSSVTVNQKLLIPKGRHVSFPADGDTEVFVTWDM